MSKALKQAIEANDPEAVRAALKTVKDVNRKLPGARAPLAYACERGADRALDPLFEAGAVAEKRNTFIDDKPFAIAAAKNQLPVLKRMLELKKVPSATLEQVLDSAAMDGRAEVFEFLLKEANPPITIGLYRLATASSKGPQMLKILLANGGDPMARHDDRGIKNLTVLHDLVTDGKAALIRILIEAGADVNARDELGRTPLMLLAQSLESIGFANNHAERTNEMLAKGEVKLLSGEAPAVVDPIEAAHTLIQLGADAKLTDRFGNDAMDYCLFSSLRENEKPPASFLEILRNAGANGSQSTTDLFRALRKQNLRDAEDAIKKGADVNRVSPGHDGATPLESAASISEENGPEFIRLLLKAGADPNRAGRKRTALMCAVRWGGLATVQELIAAGAGIHATYQSDDYLENAYTVSENKEDIRAYLKSLGAGNPKFQDGRTFKAGVASWNDFGELLVKASVKNAAEDLAKFIGGQARLDVYGETVEPGARAFVLTRPKGMDWTNVFQIAPPRLRFDDLKTIRARAVEIGKACNATVLSIEYSDTSDAASIARIEPNGAMTEDDGWDPASLKEFVDAMGNEAPAWAKKRAKESDEDAPTSTQRLVELAEREKFVVAAFSFYAPPGKKLTIEIRGYGPEAFDGVAFVSA